MIWIWDKQKDLANKAAHGISFETAKFVFDDPLAALRQDFHPDGDRWQTVGMIGFLTLFVVHTLPGAVGGNFEETGRIISAQKATAHERRAYEEGDF